MFPLKGVFAKNEKECDKKALLILLILLLSVASIRRKRLIAKNIVSTQIQKHLTRIVNKSM